MADIDTTYSGSLRYYDIEGELLGGYICVDGIIVYHISPADGYNGDNGTEDGGSGDEDSDPVAGLLYFAGQNCVPVAVPYGMYWYFFYLDSDGSWVLKEIRISRIWTEWEVECSSTEEGEIIHNFVNTAGGGGGNDSDDDDDEEDDEEISVDLMISPLYCDIGDRFTISVSISPQDADVDVAEIYIAGFGIGWKGLTTLSKNEIYHGFALQPGNFSYKATIYAGNKSYDSQEMTAVYGFPGRSKVLARQEVQTGMAQSWASTLSAANAYNTQEFGGIVMIDTRGSAPQYRYIHHQGPKVGYPESAHIKMDYDDSFSRDPRYGGQFAVMGFHTHPPLFNYTGTDILRRLVGPSDGDNIDALPQVVQDFVGINGIHTNRDPKNSPTQLYYYSVDKRTQLPY